MTITPTLDADRWTTDKVAELCGATYRQVDYWIRIGLLEPDRARPGSGFARRWDHDDVRVAQVVAALNRLGCGGPTLRQAARWCYANLWAVADDEVIVVEPDPPRIDATTRTRGLFLAGAGAWVIPAPPRIG